MLDTQQATATCMICGAWITPSFCVCANCEDEHGLDSDAAQWPEWARALATMQRAERRAEAEQSEHEVDMGWLFVDEADVVPVCELDYDTCWPEIASWNDLAYENVLNDTGADM